MFSRFSWKWMHPHVLMDFTKLFFFDFTKLHVTTFYQLHCQMVWSMTDTNTSLSYIVNTMAADALATCVVRASAAMALTKFSLNILLSEPDRLIISLGSSWSFYWNNRELLGHDCHKVFMFVMSVGCAVYDSWPMIVWPQLYKDVWQQTGLINPFCG